MVISVITSLTNPKIKRLIQLKNKARIRNSEGVFIVEGIRMFLELPGEDTVELYVTEAFLQDIKDKKGSDKQLAFFQNRYEIVSEEVFARISDTVTPQGVLAVVKQKKYAAEELLAAQTLRGKEVPLLLLIEDLQDPGNLGTMFRTAEAAGVSGIIMSRETVDIYNPKAVRSTMGSIFRVPFCYTESMREIIENIRRRDIAVYAAALHRSLRYTDVDYTRGCAILIGNEGKGLRQETVEAATQAVFIPMEGKVESLNASISAAVLLYEAARQRK